jgi:hypothetical protein
VSEHAAEMRRCLVACDIAGMRRLWAHVSPHLPQPSESQALIAIHHARTQTNSIELKYRAYSHRWLRERGYPSGLPDELKPAAERLYPRIVDGVGIAVKAMSEHRKAEAIALRGAMSDAVADAYANGNKEPEFVKARMREARDKFLRTA